MKEILIGECYHHPDGTVVFLSSLDTDLLTVKRGKIELYKTRQEWKGNHPDLSQGSIEDELLCRLCKLPCNFQRLRET
jgi:hypothetical protein